MRRTEVELLDSLTGIYSRASLKDRLQEEVDRSARYSQPFSILLLDLDHFKSVNDAFGHRRGDDILISLAERLRLYVRKSDLAFRYGGDEFILLLPGTEKTNAVELAERLIITLREETYGGSPPLKLTFSMGIASFPQDANTPEGLFDVADKRHYQAKRRGRNQIVSIDDDRSPDQPFDISLRVIDRELALDRVYSFFDALAVKKQGSLAVNGPIGVGKSRFLEEVAKIARLHGHLTLQVSGKRALKARSLGALLEAEMNWESLPSIAGGESAFLRGLHRLIEDKGNLGVVFIIDNISELDRQSIATLERIFYSPFLPHVAIAYSDGESSSPQVFTETSLAETVTLKPLTSDGVHIWLRHVLQWEAPNAFINWLHSATQGLPEKLRLSLNLLARDGFLVKKDGWSLGPPSNQGDYRNFPLAFWLQQENRQVHSGLPTELKTFVGRADELRRLKKMLTEANVVTLVGPGGIGKSRLALQAAIELEDEFADGAYEIKMAAVDRKLLDQGSTPIYSVIANAIGIPLNGKEGIRKQLLRFLALRHILLLLNDYGHFDAANPVLEDLVQQAPRVVLLLTSREPTNLPGELVYELGGLAVPDSVQTPGAMHFEAVQLFQSHAQRADQDFTLNDTNMASVINVCRLVGGMPLGIELAAAWISMFSAEELAQRIRKNYNILTAAHPDSSPAKQSIQAVFDYFWGLLSEGEQTVLAKLSVFQHQFSGIAARKVADASPFFLGALTNRVFLVKNSEGFYRMHDLLRQYGAEKLAQNPDARDQATLAHSRFYLDFLQSRTQHLRGKRQKEAQQAITTSLENIHLAWTWAIEKHEYALADASLEALYLFFDIQGQYRAGDSIFNITARMLEESTTPAERRNPGFRRIYSRVKLRGAIFNSYLGFIQEARKSIEACLKVAQEMGDSAELALCYEHLGWVYYDLALPRNEVRTLWQTSLAIYRENGIPWGIARLLYNLSFISPLAENHEMMIEKLDISTELGDLVGIGDSLLSLGGILEQLGRIGEARDHLARSLDIYEQVGHQDGIAFAHFGQGNLYLSQGRYENAAACFDRALHNFRQTGNVNGMSTSLSRICRVAIAQGDYGRAREGLRDSLALEKQSGSQIGRAYALNYLGELALVEGALADARRFLEESHQIIQEAQDEWGLGRCLANLGRLLLQEGNPEAARKRAEAGLTFARETGETAFIHASLLVIGAALLALEDWSGAGRYLLDSLSVASQRSSPPLILDSLLEIAHLLTARTESAGRAEELYRLIAGHPAAHSRARREASQRIALDERTSRLVQPGNGLEQTAAFILEHGLND